MSAVNSKKSRVISAFSSYEDFTYPAITSGAAAPLYSSSDENDIIYITNNDKTNYWKNYKAGIFKCYGSDTTNAFLATVLSPFTLRKQTGKG
ncbi:MAG: hypothetical protein LIR50_02590 [Bacillota bacterium]|nr:hypothetical protein [Bacillota bacterium]